MQTYTVLFIDADGDEHLEKMLAPDVEAAIAEAACIITDDLFHDQSDGRKLALATEWIAGATVIRAWEGEFASAPDHAPVFEEISQPQLAA